MEGDVISLKTTCFSINKKRVTVIGEEKLAKTYTGDAKNKATPFTQLSLLHNASCCKFGPLYRSAF